LLTLLDCQDEADSKGSKGNKKKAVLVQSQTMQLQQVLRMPITAGDADTWFPPRGGPPSPAAGINLTHSCPLEEYARRTHKFLSTHSCHKQTQTHAHVYTANFIVLKLTFIVNLAH